MRITMRSNSALLDRFDCINELSAEHQSRSQMLTKGCHIALNILRADENVLSMAQCLKVKSYIRESVPENIKIDITDEGVYQEIKKQVKDYFHLEKVQNPFVCKIILAIYIMNLKGDLPVKARATEKVPCDGQNFAGFASDLDRMETFMQMLKGDRKYINRIDDILLKWKNEFYGGAKLE